MENIDNEIVTDENKEEYNYHIFQINTRNALDLIFEIQDYDEFIAHDLLVEFRNNLEYTLHTRVEPSAKFHPNLWEYHRDKYIRWEKKEWSNEGANVFDPDYFMFDARNSGEIKYSSLSDEENIKVDKSAEKAKEDNWSKWGYDVFSLNSNCPLLIEKDGEEFQFFFAWQLRFIDFFEIKKFLNWHLENTFANVKESCIEYVEILFLKYKKILIDETNRKLVFDCLEKMKMEPPVMIDTISITSKKSGRPPKDKIIIVKPLNRESKDGRTIFDRDETAELFSYLARLNCIFNAPPDMSKTAFADAITALTGFSSGQIGEFLKYEDIIPKNKIDKIKIVESIKSLIINNL